MGYFASPSIFVLYIGSNNDDERERERDGLILIIFSFIASLIIPVVNKIHHFIPNACLLY